MNHGYLLRLLRRIAARSIGTEPLRNLGRYAVRAIWHLQVYYPSGNGLLQSDTKPMFPDNEAS